jgi:hypothetical protein
MVKAALDFPTTPALHPPDWFTKKMINEVAAMETKKTAHVSGVRLILNHHKNATEHRNRTQEKS